MELKRNRLNPKEKADQLYEQFSQYTPVEFEHEYTIECILICVNEIIQAVRFNYELEWIKERRDAPNFVKYWEDVKTEINKLK